MDLGHPLKKKSSKKKWSKRYWCHLEADASSERLLQLAALVFTLNLSSAISLELFETSYLMFFGWPAG